jgi:hypothetical protein
LPVTHDIEELSFLAAYPVPSCVSSRSLALTTSRSLVTTARWRWFDGELVREKSLEDTEDDDDDVEVNGLEEVEDVDAWSWDRLFTAWE